MNKLIRVIALVVLAQAATAVRPTATSCIGPIPLGHVVTPECTWIVEQFDPGVWRDNLGQYWVLVTKGTPETGTMEWPTKVALADLRIGR